MSLPQVGVLAVALLLGLASGMNDGAALLALALPARGPRPLLALLVLLVAVAGVPLVVGAHVARTLAVGLVAFGDASAGAMAVAVALSLLLITALSRRGLPTSLTLALIGSLVGLGVGLGATPAWPLVATVLAIGIGAPLVALAFGRLIAIPVRRLEPALIGDRGARAVAGAAFGLQALAYGANDGQRMPAVLLAGGLMGAAGDPSREMPLVAVALAFGLGALMGIASIAHRLGRSVLLVRAPDATASQVAASLAVLTGTALGAPVSMTQSSAAALVGAGLARGRGRIRWRTVIDLMAAWIVTLPLAAAAGTVAGLAARAIHAPGAFP